MNLPSTMTGIPGSIFSGEEVQTYLIRGERNTLIDTGTLPYAQSSIVPTLENLGLTLADIDLILNTHAHPDHTGGNGLVKDAGNALIYLYKDEARYLEDHAYSYRNLFGPVIEAVMGTKFAEEEKARFLQFAGPDLTVDKPLEDNDMIDLGKGCELRVVHIPGHSPGSVGFYWEKEGILFSGDALGGLHNETGGLPILSDIPAYKKSLDRVESLSARVLLHSHPFRGVSLPSSFSREGNEVGEFLRDCRQVAELINEAAERIAGEGMAWSFAEFADKVIAAMPEELEFKPLSQIPLPRFNALTILSTAAWKRIKGM
jgi:glyoxylase-like metal-dependent hydrolase (beta-lactamase superfamily II)